MTVNPAAVYNFEYVPGDSSPIVFRLKAGGVAFDLTGSWFSLEFLYDRALPPMIKTTTGGGLVATDVEGEIRFTPTPEESTLLLLSSRRGTRYKLIRHVTGGETRTLVMGHIKAFTGD